MTALPDWAETIGSLLGAIALIATPIWAYKGSAKTSRAAAAANQATAVDNLIQRLQDAHKADQEESEREAKRYAEERKAEREETARQAALLADLTAREAAARNADHDRKMAEVRASLDEAHAALARAVQLEQDTNRKSRILSDYIYELREHIASGKPPPPPAWPPELR